MSNGLSKFRSITVIWNSAIEKLTNKKKKKNKTKKTKKFAVK